MHNKKENPSINLCKSILFALATEDNLNKTELRLFYWFLGTVQEDGSIDIDLKTLSDTLGLSKPSISTALKGLVQRNIVLRKDHSRYDRTPLPEEFSVPFDQLNYRVAFKGDTSEYGTKKLGFPEIEIPHGDCKWMNVNTGKITIDEHQLNLRNS